MKLTSDMLRQIIKEEIGRAKNAPVSLTPRQLKKLIVTESSRVLAEQKSYSDLNRQITIVDMQLPGFVKVKGKNASIETAMKAALGEVKSLLKASSSNLLKILLLHVFHLFGCLPLMWLFQI